MNRPLQKMLLSVATIVLVLFGLVAPVSAQDAVVTDAAPDVAVRPDIADDVELLRLRCRGRLDRDGMPGVLCNWSRPTADDAAYIVLERKGGDSNRWAPVLRTKNVRAHRYFDESVEPGVRYRYRVRVYNVDHELVAASRSRGAGVPIPEIDILRIACKGDNTDAGKIAACEWSASEDAKAYQLWRIVNRGHRELVGTYGADVRSVRDTDIPDDANVVRYAVVALDGEREIIGRSRLAKVRFFDVATALSDAA